VGRGYEEVESDASAPRAESNQNTHSSKGVGVIRVGSGGVVWK
jgi:hypothetical protein